MLLVGVEVHCVTTGTDAVVWSDIIRRGAESEGSDELRTVKGRGRGPEVRGTLSPNRGSFSKNAQPGD